MNRIIRSAVFLALSIMVDGCGDNLQDSSVGRGQVSLLTSAATAAAQVLGQSATLEIQGFQNNIPMTVNADGSVQTTINSIPAGSWTFKITYMAPSVSGTVPIMQATGVGEVVAASTTTVTLSSLTYNFDSDNDGVLNLEEVKAGTDPKNQSSPGAPGIWTTTGSLSINREGSSATLLPQGTLSGKVLVNGGCCFPAVTEVFNPNTGTWQNAGNLLTGGKVEQPAVVLSDGRVLVIGGWNGSPNATAELYDSNTGNWIPTAGMGRDRSAHTATLLTSGQNAGKVLVAGGCCDTNTAELYTPATGSWSATGPMQTVRRFHTATLLPNGTVLVVGGYTGSQLTASAEIYNPSSGGWTNTNPIPTARQHHTATLLSMGPNAGRVLVVGGDSGGGAATPSAQIYNPATGTWSATGNLSTARSQHTATLLLNGKILVVGGESSPGNIRNSAELYNPQTGTWAAASSMNNVRIGHSAVLLPLDQVLVIGGTGSAGTTAELYSASNQ